MTQDFPDLREGEVWSDQSALQWRNLVDAVHRFNDLAVGPGLRLDKAGQGWHLSLIPKPPVRVPPPSKAVVLVEVPSGNAEGRPWLLVREVEYNTPARLAEPEENPDHPYRWRDVAFQAYPQIGRTPADYFGSLWDERDDQDNLLPSPTLAATFLTATFDGSVWTLDLPKASMAITVVLVETPDAEESSILKIRRVKYEDAPPEPVRYAWDGEAFDSYPAFGLTADNFAGLEWDPTADGVPDAEKTTFLKARFVGGFWLVDKPAVIVAQFKLDRVLGNVLRASFFDGNEQGREVQIAKPYQLRLTPFDGRSYNGVSYEYSSGSRRTARVLGQTETQIIVPPYVVNDIIYATKHVAGGVDVSVGLETIVWLDDNRDGRAWAAEFEGEGASA